MQALDFHYLLKSPVTAILLGLLGLAVLIQLGYILLIFTRLIFQKNISSKTDNLPAVSVVVCAHNEIENLRALLPILETQDYPIYDVTVVDDRSNEETLAFLCNDCSKFTKMRFLRIEKDYEHVTPKKYALTAGIRNAKHEVILLTDADCRPVSNQWIRSMASQLNPQKQIVIGFSPYTKQVGFLNRFVRFETFYVAVQYLSFAVFGKPYMGVGRNLMYHKSLFIKNKGFYSHLKVMGGDDDLLMNEIATSQNTAICTAPESFVETFSKNTWHEWFTQKTRHLSVSNYYKSQNKAMLGVLSTTHVLTWVLALVIAVLAVIQNNTIIYISLGVIFGFRLLVQWFVLALANKKLGRTIGWYAPPFIDFCLFVYYIYMSIVLWRNRKTKITWR
jgi:glycosyltransferase involved in cell wall biosynthesis